MIDKNANPTIRAATAAFIESMLPALLTTIREVARARGYAVAVHGSLARDIDLIAVPWVEHADEPADLVEAIRGAVGGVLGRCLVQKHDEGDGPKEGTDRPHGRQAYLLIHPGFVGEIDLSVMPLARAPELTP